MNVLLNPLLCVYTIKLLQFISLAGANYRITKQHTLLVTKTAHIFMSCRKGQHYSILWLVHCVESVSWSGTFSYVTMFGHVEYAAVAS